MSFFPGHMFVTSARKDSQPAPHWTPTDVSTPARSLTSVRLAEKASLPAPTFTTTGWPISRLDLIFEKRQIKVFVHGLFSGQTSPMSRMSKVLSYARWFAASFKNPLFFPFLLSFHLSTSTLCTKLPITAFTNDRSHGTEGSHCQFVQDHLGGKTFHLFPKG